MMIRLTSPVHLALCTRSRANNKDDRRSWEVVSKLTRQRHKKVAMQCETWVPRYSWASWRRVKRDSGYIEKDRKKRECFTKVSIYVRLPTVGLDYLLYPGKAEGHNRLVHQTLTPQILQDWRKFIVWYRKRFGKLEVYLSRVDGARRRPGRRAPGQGHRKLDRKNFSPAASGQMFKSISSHTGEVLGRFSIATWTSTWKALPGHYWGVYRLLIWPEDMLYSLFPAWERLLRPEDVF